MPGCIQPISSPMMNRMLGLAGACAVAGRLAIVVAVHNTARAPQIALNMLMFPFLNAGCRSPGRSLRPIQGTDRTFAFWPIQDHASGAPSDALRTGNWSKRPGYAMRFRQVAPMFADHVAA